MDKLWITNYWLDALSREVGHWVYFADEVDKVIAEKDLALKETHKIAYEIQPQENERLDEECTKRQLEIYRLRKALEFYADEAKYDKTPARSVTITTCEKCGHEVDEQDFYEADIMMDKGKRATKALGGEKKEE